MLIKTKKELPESTVTDQSVYMNRRQFMQSSAAAAVALAMNNRVEAAQKQVFESLKKTRYGKGLKLTEYEDATSYNNFYEFGTAKSDPAKHAKHFKPRPWTITVSGEAEKTGQFDLQDILKSHPLEERIYRLRCVEAWSMVIPWVGFPLGDLIKRFQPTSKAKYVSFETLVDPKQMPGQKRPTLDWPYQEGLRMDEAMHPLTLMAVGMYGEVMPNQNGAPIRLVVPWKYGFKSIKSIVRIHFSETMPLTTWAQSIPEEYGFYANVNPEVDHPRWSQAKERRVGEGLGWFNPKIETLMFNGYADEVAGLYTGMDLSKFY